MDPLSAPLPCETAFIGASGPVTRAFLETKRGCPYSCRFCQHSSGEKSVEFSLSRVGQAIDQIVTKRAARVHVVDPVFNMPKSTYPDVLELFRCAGYSGTISLETRAELEPDKLLAACSNLNVLLEVGLQTVAPEELRSIGRDNNMQALKYLAKLCHSHGVRFTLSVIYGLPHQTPETFRRTLDFALQLKPFGPVKAYPLALLPGSELELQRQEHGFETNHDPVPLVTSSRYFTHEQWLEMRAMASSQQAM